jgi:putative ATP-dependent endonuclease of the OLD family
MKIKKVEISKFRSIETGSFDIDDILGIVGQNNSGKTAILRALNSFFNPNKELQYFLSGVNLYSTNRAIPRIIISFSNIPNKPIYTPYIANGLIKFKQEYNKNRGRLEYYVFNNGVAEIAQENLIEELNKDVQFVLIPTDRTSEFYQKNGDSVLSELLKLFFANHTAKRDTLTPKVKDAFDYLNKNALKKVAQGIEGRYLTNKGFEFKIGTNTAISFELFLNDLEILINEDGKEFNIKDCGSGIQSLVAIAIYRYLAELKHTNFIIGLEEPETNLHPQGQKELIYTLFDQVQNSNIQVLFTTHSTVLVDQLDHTKILLIRKIKDNQRAFKSKLLQLRNDFWVHYNLQRLQYDKFHKFRNSEFFFANHVLVTESTIDSGVFSVLLENKGVKIERKGISILQLDGITSLKYAFYLLRDLEIPKTIIIDKDFFFNYQNGNKDNSRYASGFFNYQAVFKNEILINEIFYNQNKRQQLEGLLTTNHSRALDISEEYDVICMKYNLEMDLVASTIAQNLIYNYLNIPIANRNTNEILNTREKPLKKLDTLLHVINNLPHKNLPNSYKRLVKRIKEI